jgi:peptide chain release factor 2
VAAVDFPAEIRLLRQTFSSIREVSDLDRLRSQIAELSAQASAPDLWNDPDAAQRVTSRLSHSQAELDRVEKMGQSIDDLEVLVEMAEEADDAETRSEAERELVEIRKGLSELEVRTLLSGEYDGREALLTIRAEAGGVDAADFAEMLLRMYLRWAERHGYEADVMDSSYAEEAGIKSATVAVHAPYAYGTLSVEQGTHRLVRISPFDNQGRRQTSFAAVEVLPVVEERDHIEIPENDLRVDVFRSSGPGGQSVNTTDSAVRLTHVPTGIVVSCQNEKSQLQNKAAALRVLQARLLERARLERQAELDALKTDAGGSWGNQMRSYVLHPYQMVKDLRTEHEVGNPNVGLRRGHRRVSRDRHPLAASAGARSGLSTGPLRLASVIRFEHVTKIYDRTSRPALEDVTLEIERGEFVFLVGASGSGKSTCLRLVLKEEEVTRGTVRVAGRDVASLSSWKVPHLRRQIGVVFQDFRLLPNKTVFENVAFALQVIGKSRHQIAQTVPETLELVGLAGKEKRLPHELSGGEQQRVAIARAFVNRPAILLADEPTGNLDPTTSIGIMRLLDRINRRGTTVVMATHDDEIVDQMRKRVVELDDGQIVRDQSRGVYGYSR